MTQLTGAYFDDIRLDAVALITAALAGDAEGLVVVGQENADRAPALVGTLVALCAGLLRALPEASREGVLSAWRAA